MTQEELLQLIASNARAIQANAAAIADLRADHADVLEGCPVLTTFGKGFPDLNW